MTPGKRKPLYIGVTGFMTQQEVRAALRCFDEASRYKLMVGVLVSLKTLSGGTNKYPNRYPKMERIKEIFQDNPQALNLVHYNTDNPGALCDQLRTVEAWVGELLHGFQLNIAWPDIGELVRFHSLTKWKYRMVLQIGGRAMQMVGYEPKGIADRIGEYLDKHQLIHDVLVDPSGGKGQPFDTRFAIAVLKEIVHRDYDTNIGIAGGLGPHTLKPLLEPILEEILDVNIDAEGQLRDKQSDDLDVELACDYLHLAQGLLSINDDLAGFDPDD